MTIDNAFKVFSHESLLPLLGFGPRLIVAFNLRALSMSASDHIRHAMPATSVRDGSCNNPLRSHFRIVILLTPTILAACAVLCPSMWILGIFQLAFFDKRFLLALFRFLGFPMGRNSSGVCDSQTR